MSEHEAPYRQDPRSAPIYQPQPRNGLGTTGFVNLYGTGHSFSGYLYRAGEKQGDLERYWINDAGKVCTEKAEMRWPDGTLVEL